MRKEEAERIRKKQEDSIRLAKEAEEKNVYRNNHKPMNVPVNKESLYCDFCKKFIEVDDVMICCGATKDSIAWMDMLKGVFGLRHHHIHKASLPQALKSQTKFKYHYEVFKDSLYNNFISIKPGDVEYFYGVKFLEYINEISKKAPNGFFESWSWNNEYSNISFSFTYTNTNKKTIKYIEVFWRAYNDVGDVRKTGSFKGTGPVKEWDSGSWRWEHSNYYVAGDTSNMKLTKVIITYMNGSQVVIPQNKIVYN